MTATSDVTAGDAPNRQVPELRAVLAALREHTTALAASGPPPSHVRVETAGIVLELDWYARPADAVSPAGAVAPAGDLEQVPRSWYVEPPAVEPPAAATEPTAAPGTVPAGHRVTAPTVGVFYRSPEPGAPPFVTEGDVVAAGQQVAIVEAMKLMIPVEADQAGRVVAVLCSDSEPVEYGQPLLVLAEGG